MQTRCSKCDAPMNCQPEGGCWCAELPHALPVPAEAQATGCLCRACLLEKMKDAGASSTKGSSSSASTDAAPPVPNSNV